ncbi:MAG TPA: pyridoxal-dependent decarboxylase [Candidatus Saccharimonadales bacterium]|jgi:glutamate/tyrosine decarboxylase-like PLP-dependent enzyme|nr:pyridoxal-dependent decarboxylase [Candidatus Saccharimonadales bacterium]
MKNPDWAFRKPLETAFKGALAYLEGLDRNPAAVTVDLHTLRERLNRPLTRQGVPPEQVVDELIQDVEGGIIGSAGGRFYGWVIGGTLPAAMAADWMTSAWDQNAALYSCAPAAAVVEEIAGVWLKGLLGLPAEASFALVTGNQMAHVTCLAAARHALLARRGWDVERRGLFGAPPIRLLASGQQHGTVLRAVRLLGLGTDQVVDLESDIASRMKPEALQKALEENDGSPVVVLLQAGDINTGGYDRFEQIIPLAKKHGAWVHVDGAFGLWAAASPRYRHQTLGMEGADSWVTDGHKWLNTPYDCGFAFVVDTEAHRASMSHRASYITHDPEARDQVDWNPEWSRRARGFAVYAALRQLGREGLATLVERCGLHARELVAGIGALPGAEIMWKPIINQGMVRFLDSRSGATGDDHDRRTDEVIAAIVADGEAFFGATTWRGRRCMRISVSNWMTGEEDVKRTVAAVQRAMGRI